MMPFHFTKSLASLLRIVSLFILLVGSAVSTTQAQIVTYFHNDISGTPMAATNAIGNLLWKESYRPYGERLLNTANPTTNTLWFGGKSQDPTTGLSYLGARYYNPQLGRFMGIDPKEVDPEDLHSFNRYAYGNNNPYKFVDPDGEFAFLVFAISAITSGIITDNALNAYRQNTSVFDEGISSNGVKAAAASMAKDTAIAAGATLVSNGLGVVGSRILGNATKEAVIGRKLDYLFGKATGRAHNIDRSTDMLRQMERIGIPDTAANRQLMTEHFAGVLNDATNIAGRGRSGETIRESLLMGPNGAVKVESIWDGNILQSFKLKGVGDHYRHLED